MSRRPNVLFLFTDDQRHDTIGALGNPHIHTPHLDRLVERGTSFTANAIMGGSCGAVCMPSRAMLHTGRTLFHLDDLGASIPAEHTLLGETFRAAGYETFGTGKWHQRPADYARSFSAGAEIFFGGMNDHWNVPACEFDPTGQYPEPRPLARRWNDTRVEGGCRWDHIRAGRHSTDLFADATCDWLSHRDSDRPFFGYVSFMAPHDPREMPAEYLNLYRPGDLPVPANFTPEHGLDYGQRQIRDEVLAPYPRTEAIVRRHLAEYYAMISHLDAAVGRILETLEATGHGDDTYLVFAGDNGLAVGQHGLMGKQNCYDHSLRVPLLIAGPDLPRDHLSRAASYLLDVFPTLCELCGLAIPDSVEGVSLTPAFDAADWTPRPSRYFAYTDVIRAVDDGRWKLIEYVVGGQRHTQLFDHARDPDEVANLAHFPDYRTEVARLRTELFRLREHYGDTRERERAFWDGFEGQLLRG